MKKNLFAFSAMMFCGLTLCAQHISEQQALDRVVQFLNSPSSTNARRVQAKNRELKSVPVEAESVYAFNVEGGGFVIASGDSRALPVLGYSTTGSIDWEQMPENMRAWLKSYDDAVATLGDQTDFIDGHPLDARQRQVGSLQNRTPVEPLIKSHWSQEAPYWNQVPLYEGANPNWQGQNCYTGCGATALAQVLNFYKWPKTLPDGIPAYDYLTKYNDLKKVRHIDALPPATFDWDNMLDDYEVFNPEIWQYEILGTEAQQDAVATLMRYCGQALQMEYSPAGSSADERLPQPALVNYFDYPAATFINRVFFGIDEWEDIIYGELANGRPVLYTGYASSTMGHAFICDGYDDNGLFHINWGWGGTSDGYFALSVLNPYNNTSAGSSSSLIGFSRIQSAIIYIHPTLEKQPDLNGAHQKLYQRFNMKAEPGNKAYYYLYYNRENFLRLEADHALGTMDDDGHLTPRFMGVSDMDYVAFFNNVTYEIDSTAFQPGESLTLYPMLRFHEPGAEWEIVPPLASHLVAGRTADGHFYMTANGETTKLECIDVAISQGTGRVGERNDLTIHVRNLNDKDYSSDLVLRPLYYGHVAEADITDDTPCYKGEQMECGAYIRAGQTDEVTLPFIPLQSGLVVLKAYDAKDSYLGSLTLELTNDTVVIYDQFLENRSYYTREGDKGLYHVELCDKPNAQFLRGVPSDSIGLRVYCAVNGQLFENLKLRNEIKEYLKALPEKGGQGDYKFTYEMPFDLSREGEYVLESYVGEWIDGNRTALGCSHSCSFQLDDPTGIKPTTATTTDEPYFDLMGRQLNGIPTQQGVYIKGRKKIIVGRNF